MNVAIVMGSDSDAPVMGQAAEALDEFGIGWEMRVLSAHRTPDDTLAYARSAASRDIAVVIAGAGGAAHLPGVIAATTTLPVIGVPIALKNLDGLDSLLSIAQMPKGIPVATVAVDGARNAGLLAVRIMAVGNSELTAKLEQFVGRMADEVRGKDAALQERLASGA
ncbi:MAG TPA: 5-(carboxyamino)imidazole ribonucleotide mutase [Acidimicrobiales bacterium]|nr:5-(carboxyamino)imidazole ribonucleotide mutase [Acidimicrobiales bacterium]